LQQLAIKCSLNHLQESPTRIDKDKRSEDVSEKMSAVIYDYQNKTEEEEDDESEISRAEKQVLNRQVSKRWQFTLYKKMAAV
jgi:hypothetical protein